MDMAGFLTAVNSWWTIENARKQFCSNCVANAIVCCNGKFELFNAMAHWLQKWEPTICSLSKQILSALITTPRAPNLVISELGQEGCDFVVPLKFQTDSLERWFSQYWQMNGRRFLVSFREANNREKILKC